MRDDSKGYWEISEFPSEAISDCSGPGPADDAVAHWVDELDFQPDTDATRSCLSKYGTWDAEQLSDDDENRERVFWIMMGDFAEWDGTDDSPCGTDLFTLGI